MGRKENLNNAKQIYQKVMNDISTDKEQWKEFLEFSSKFYKYSFTENLLMFGQDKDITMCATLPEWNSIGRWVKPKRKSIKILRDTENDVQLDYVFDVKDTYARRDIPNAYTDERLETFKWKATEEEVIKILSEYLHFENIDKLETIVAGYMATAIDDSGLLLNLSEEEENLVLKPEFLELLIKSTTYQIATRAGIEIKDKERIFTEYEEMANPIAMNIVGNCVNHSSAELLKIIEYKVKQIKKEELKNGVRKIWNDSEEEFKGDVSNEIQPINDRNNIDGEIGGERTRDIETERDNREESERTKSSTENERIYRDGEIQPDDRGISGGTTTTNVGRENLIKENREVEKTTSFSLPKNNVSDELIDKILMDCGNTQGGEEKAKELIRDDLISKKDKIIGIRNIYGDSGVSTDEYKWESKAKGLTIEDKNQNKITLSWAEVLTRTSKVLKLENEQLGFDTFFNLAYQEDEIIPKEDNSKYDFINDLIGEKITLNGREYKISKLDIDKKEIEIYDHSIKGWYPLFNLMNLDEFVAQYTREHGIKQDEEDITQEKANYEMPTIIQENRNLKQRTIDNINAIKLLNKIEIENRLATISEQEVLAKFTGWGGLSKVFGSAEWEMQRNELKEILSEEDYADAQASTINAFYTNATIIDGIYAGLSRLGFKGGNILEPSARNRKFSWKNLLE